MRENLRQEASGVAVMPPGVILSYAGASAPAGWLLCDGTAYNGTTSPEYANLFAAIGNVWGGSDITDFKVPNNQGVGQTGAGTQTINTRVKGYITGTTPGALGDTVEDAVEDHEHDLLVDGNTACGGAGLDILSDVQTTLDVWVHMAVVLVGNEAGLYANGLQIGYDTFTGGVTTGTLFIGSSGTPSDYLNAGMQDLHISYNNPYNASPNVGVTDTFTVPAATMQLVMQ